MTAVHKLG
jgi:hypothetical protein